MKDISAAKNIADIIELRLDLISRFDLSQLTQATTLPVIVTNRTKLEGGQFKGTEEERVDILKQAIAAGADYIDIETSTPKELLQSVLANKGKTRAILSYHNFSNTLEDLEPLYEIMCDLPGDILKIVTYAQDINDNLKMFQLLKRAKQENRKLIALCMGDNGEISRVLSPLFGGFLTFGALATGKESAPGQILASTLKNVYRADRQRENFRIYGVIGNPVAKSMGYLIHNRAFQEIGSNDIYVSFLVKNVEKFFNEFKAFFSGLSVTMPCKESVMPLLDEVDETAKKIGAVNTVVKENNGWKGYNTDCTGAVQALEAHLDLKNKNVLIIGSGGTAKAIGYGVVEKGAHLTVTYNRNKERGVKLAEELGCRLAGIRDIGDHDFDVLINCSPVGMSPNVDKTPFSNRYLKKEMLVFDSVYNPPETRLIKEAKKAGCRVISGVELFINQAVGQFEMWAGKKAPAQAMRDVLMEKIEEQPEG
ncbi:MAG: shikimate dehydrogenase (NADP(+)) [Nitrospinaceae bacterium]|nr:MAG: shikimate dehydrogenase (NADP(+)) [Nitrospinaceae bacterium]